MALQAEREEASGCAHSECRAGETAFCQLPVRPGNVSPPGLLMAKNEGFKAVLMRRDFLHWLLLGSACLAVGAVHAPPAQAGDDDSGSDDNGNDNGNDDGANDDGGDDDGNEGEYASDDSDQDEALIARQSGSALPAGDLVAMLKKKLRGEILDIRVVKQIPAAYDVKMINSEGRIGTVRVAASNFKILRMTGF